MASPNPRPLAGPEFRWRKLIAVIAAVSLLVLILALILIPVESSTPTPIGPCSCLGLDAFNVSRTNGTFTYSSEIVGVPESYPPLSEVKVEVMSFSGGEDRNLTIILAQPSGIPISEFNIASGNWSRNLTSTVAVGDSFLINSYTPLDGADFEILNGGHYPSIVEVSMP
jgi:hypothetical protein